MPTLNKICKDCKAPFHITEEQQKLYELVAPVIGEQKFPLPLPQTCWADRELQLLTIRNEKTLYKRTCDLSGRPIVALYAPESPFKVYGQEEYWSDKWNALDYGREFDFNRPFFEQFAELMKEVPRIATINRNSENSEFCNYSFSNKNCYLLFGSHYEEDCMYGWYATKNKDSLDYFQMYESELCYGCTFTGNCNRCVYVDHTQDSNECWFSMDLKGCDNCIFSFGLRHKKYHIFNKPYSKEQYEAYIQKLNLSSYKGFQAARKMWEKYRHENAVYRAQYQTNCQNCEGTEHQNSKNLQDCFGCTNCEDCAFGFQMDGTYTSIDNSHAGYDRCELCYKTIGCNGVYGLVVCDSVWQSSNLLYCNLCFSTKNCFGSVGLRQNEYCILNKQYSKEEYEQLAPKIIEHMKKTDEWGEFFPTAISPFAYNETIAQEFLPLTKEEVLKKGWRWRDEETKIPGELFKNVPDNIQDVDDSICQKILSCEVTGKQYKILPQELTFYKKLNLPIPLRCPDQRRKELVDMSIFMKSHKRTCAKTGKPITTIYGPEQAKIVYSEEAYLKEVYS